MEEAFRFVRGMAPGFEAQEGLPPLFQCLRNSNFQWPDTGKQDGGRVVEIRCGTWKGKIMKKDFRNAWQRKGWGEPENRGEDLIKF